MSLSRARYIAIVICAGLLLMFAMTARSAWNRKCATFDEPLHFVSSWLAVHDSDYRVDVEDPPLWKYYVAAGTDSSELRIDTMDPLWNQMLHSVVEGQFVYNTLFRQPGVDARGLLSAAQLRMIVLATLLGALIAWWAWRLAGPWAAVVATAAFSMDPNFLAHGALVKNDVPMSLVFLALTAAAWLTGERATLLRILCLCVLLGAALTTKFSGILGISMVAAALAIRALLPQPWIVVRSTLNSRPRRMIAAGIIFAGACICTYVMMWAAYAFRFTPGVDPDDLISVPAYDGIVAVRQETIAHGSPMHPPVDLVEQWLSTWQPRGLVAFVNDLNDAHALPQSWLMGFLYTYGTTLLRDAYFCGEVRNDGWWYYFPMAMAFKSPLSTLGALALAAISMAWWKPMGKISVRIPVLITITAIGIPLALFPFFHPGLREFVPVFTCVILSVALIALAGVVCWAWRASWENPWPVVATAVCPVIYMATAVRSHFNLGLRHVLPVYPFLFIFLGVAAAHALKRWPRPTMVLIFFFIAGLAVESFSAFPDYIPFINAAVGGSRAGIRLLSDSNIDWGQELPDLARWQQANPNRHIYIRYFGQVEPTIYNLHVTQHFNVQQVVQTDPTAVFAISAVALQNTYLTEADPIEPFRHMEPLVVLGGSLYLFNAPSHPVQ